MRLTHILAAAGITGIAALAPAAPALATFPGHSGRLVFGVPSDQGVQLHTVRPNGHDLRQITGVEGDAVHPDWSPDGRTIVFELDAGDGANVAFIPADGGPIRVVPAPLGTFEGQPSYMPDGRHVLFTQFNGEEEATWTMRLDGSQRRRITAGPGDATDPNAAPDGRAFSYVGVHDHNWEVEQALVRARSTAAGSCSCCRSTSRSRSSTTGHPTAAGSCSRTTPTSSAKASRPTSARSGRTAPVCAS